MPRRPLACFGDMGLLRVRRRAPGCRAAGAPRAENPRRAHDTRGVRPISTTPLPTFMPLHCAASHLLLAYPCTYGLSRRAQRRREPPPPTPLATARRTSYCYVCSRLAPAFTDYQSVGCSRPAAKLLSAGRSLKFDARKTKKKMMNWCVFPVFSFSFLFLDDHAEVRRKVGQVRGEGGGGEGWADVQ